MTWWNSNWAYLKKLTFNNSGQAENLVNFPVLVKLTTANFDFAKAQSAGQDIRFVDADNTTELKYEIEKWTANTEAWIWVKVPQINASSATDFIYMYYGNAGAAVGQDITGTWNANYVAVYHSYDNPNTSTIQDSTANNNDGAKKGANEPIEITGQIYKAQDFDGTDDIVTVPYHASYGVITELTVEVWFKGDATAAGVIVARDNLNIARLWKLGASNTVFYYQYVGETGGDYVTIAADVTLNSNLAMVWKAGDRREFYINGVQKHSAAFAGSLTNSIAIGIGIGGRLDGNFERIEGIIDEVRISNVARSAAWIKASYLSETDAYITFGIEARQILQVPRRASW